MCYFFECLVKFTCKAIQCRTFVYWAFLITASILLIVIDLLRFSGFSWISFGRLYILRVYPFLPDCPIYWHVVVYNIFLQFFIFLWCQLLLLLHFNFIYLSSFFFLVSLVNNQSIFFIFSKNQILDSFCCIIFYTLFCLFLL